MRVYLAGRVATYSAASEAAATLEKVGFTVVSTWHRSDELSRLLKEHSDWIATDADTRLKNFGAIWKGMASNEGSESLSTLTELQPPLEQPPARDVRNLKAFLTSCKREIKSADYVIAHADGGAMEAGYALALGKPVILFGDLPGVLSLACTARASDFYQACALLSSLVRRSARANSKRGNRGQLTT